MITDLHRHLLFDSTDPTLLAGVDNDDDDDTSLAGVLIPVTTDACRILGLTTLNSSSSMCQ